MIRLNASASRVIAVLAAEADAGCSTINTRPIVFPAVRVSRTGTHYTVERGELRARLEIRGGIWYTESEDAADVLRLIRSEQDLETVRRTRALAGERIA